MTKTVDELKAEFELKVPELTQKLEEWFSEEAAAIDSKVIAGAPAGTGGSILTIGPAIDSKRVLDATIITEEVLKIELPPEIIKPGGYESCEAMLADIVPKLKMVFTGEFQVKKRKPEPAPVGE